jgi:hypothetical protein
LGDPKRRRETVTDDPWKLAIILAFIVGPILSVHLVLELAGSTRELSAKHPRLARLGYVSWFLTAYWALFSTAAFVIHILQGG